MLETQDYKGLITWRNLAEISTRMLTYGIEKINLNKKHEVCIKI